VVAVPAVVPVIATVRAAVLVAVSGVVAVTMPALEDGDGALSSFGSFERPMPRATPDAAGDDDDRHELGQPRNISFILASRGVTLLARYRPVPANTIEHRLFSFISRNWRGRSLISYEVIVNVIAATTTSTGLKV